MMIKKLIIVLLITFPLSVNAAEFRKLKAIGAASVKPTGAISVNTISPIDRNVVQRAVQKLSSSWNKGQLDTLLSEDFYDKERLSDNIDSLIPRDAKLRILAIQNYRTIEQYEHEGALVSRVAVTVQTQIEFNDLNNGFQRIPGTTEYILKVTQGGQ